MAVFTLAKDEKGNPFKYESKRDLESLIYYCCNNQIEQNGFCHCNS